MPAEASRRIALVSALAPSTMNSRQTAGSRPRSIRLSISACTDGGVLGGAFDHPERMLVALSRRSRARPPAPGPCRCGGRRSGSPEGRAATGPTPSTRPCVPPTAPRSGATAADFERAIARRSAGTSPSGSRTARPNLRVETLISIRFIAQRPSQSSARAACPSSPALAPRRRGHAPAAARSRPCRHGSRSCPVVRPQRWPRRPCRSRVPSARKPPPHPPPSSCPASRSRPSGRSARSDADTSSQAFAHRRRRQCSRNRGNSLHGVALLSWIRHPEPTGSRRATPLLLFQHRAGHPPEAGPFAPVRSPSRT